MVSSSGMELETTEAYKKEFLEFLKVEGCVTQQVSNWEETGLFWKKMLCRTYDKQGEKALPSHKPMKDRLTLLLCANTSET